MTFSIFVYIFKLLIMRFYLISFLLLSFSIFAQKETLTKTKDSIFLDKNQLPSKISDSIQTPEKKWNFGCGFGLNFVGGTSLNLAPNATYKLNDKISFGGGIQANYNNIKNVQNTFTIGVNALTMYNLIKNLQTLLEFSQMRVSSKSEIAGTTSRGNFWDTALFIGAGYNITPKFSIGAKYNLLYKEGQSVFTSPIIPFINIGF
jgi:hypothetical protein